MSAPTLPDPLLIDQGATWTAQVAWKASTGAAVPLTGYTARMQLRTSHQATTTVLDLSTSTGELVIDESGGTVTATVAPAVTAALEAPSQGVWDLVLTSPSGVVTRLLQGRYQITPRVTRS